MTTARIEHADGRYRVISEYALRNSARGPASLVQSTTVWDPSGDGVDPVLVASQTFPRQGTLTAVHAVGGDRVLVGSFTDSGETVVESHLMDAPVLSYHLDSGWLESVVPAGLASTTRLLLATEPELSIVSCILDDASDTGRRVLIQFASSGDLHSLDVSTPNHRHLLASPDVARAHGVPGARHVPELERYRFDPSGGRHVTGDAFYAFFGFETFAETADAAGFTDPDTWEPAMDDLAYGVILQDRDADGDIDRHMPATEAAVSYLTPYSP